ncbi:uncharacterized protein [Dysidea avara]
MEAEKVQIRFISARAPTKPSTVATVSDDDDKIVVDLREHHDLIKPSEHDTWANTMITPLRDRIMITWVFRTAAAGRHLTDLVSKVDKLLSDKERQQLEVLVYCDTGKHLSVVFVEKLVDYYTHESDHRCNLMVTRKHKDAFAGEWGKNKRFVWQHYCKTSTDERNDMNISHSFSTWKVFTSDEIEEAFQKDPYAKEVTIGDYVCNFETGFVLRQKTKHCFRLRCTMIPSEDKFLTYTQLTPQLFKSAARGYNAAGILPVCVDPLSNGVVCLLGEMTYDTFTWCDFGGLRSRLKLWEDHSRTAARECYEETLGVLGTCDELYAMAGHDDVFKVYNTGTNYVAHFVPMPFKDYPSLFNKERSDHLEMCQLRWVQLADLRSATKQARRQVSCVEVRVNTVPTGPDDKTKFCKLRPELVSTLCVAEKLGFLSALENLSFTATTTTMPVSIGSPVTTTSGPQLSTPAPSAMTSTTTDPVTTTSASPLSTPALSVTTTTTTDTVTTPSPSESSATPSMTNITPPAAGPTTNTITGSITGPEGPTGPPVTTTTTPLSTASVARNDSYEAAVHHKTTCRLGKGHFANINL